ncbi:hypothetical protein [Dongia sp.]|uniref:hypothetical protein n=1 Tax=Dongia sp. TaxID=1977262 RepID=UPI0035AE1F42
MMGAEIDRNQSPCRLFSTLKMVRALRLAKMMARRAGPMQAGNENAGILSNAGAQLPH